MTVDASLSIVEIRHGKIFVGMFPRRPRSSMSSATLESADRQHVRIRPAAASSAVKLSSDLRNLVVPAVTGTLHTPQRPEQPLSSRAMPRLRADTRLADIDTGAGRGDVGLRRLLF